MKLEGFIGQAYTLDSPNVDAQRCVNLYPEVIESGKGKEGQVAYFRGTPGLELFEEIGDGPIRCIHVDSIGRVFVVSGATIFAATKKALWQYRFDPITPGAISITGTSLPDIDTSADTIPYVGHGFVTGLKIRITNPPSNLNTLSPLVLNTDYFVIKVDDDNFALAETFDDAENGTKINITADPSAGQVYVFTPQDYDSRLDVKHIEIDFASGSFRSEAHGLPNGLVITFKGSGPSLSAITDGTTYYVAGRTTDTFKLATSRANALAGTTIALTDVSDQWWISALSDNGLYSGDAVQMSTTSGVVKAASMSFGGDGTDSSTVFVDGTSNYLFKDDLGDLSFGILGTTRAAQAIFNITNDITLYTTVDADNLIANKTIQIRGSAYGTGPYTYILFYTSDASPSVLKIDIYVGSGTSFSTSDLVQYINTGSVEGKLITLNSGPMAPIGAYTNIASFAGFVASGGGAQSVQSEFSSSSPTPEPFTKTTVVGPSYTTVPSASDITWSDGYFILVEGGTNRFRVSELQSFNLDALSFSSSEGSPDIALALEVINRYLYIFNEKTIEVYANTGNPDFPFERIQGGFIEFGLLAKHSVAIVGTTLVWLGRTVDGDGTIFAMEGTQPRRISTHAIEQAIRGYADPSSAVAWTYQSAGHGFYVLNFDEATWVYDFATQMWHERAYLNDGELERHRAQVCAYIPSTRQHLVGDYESNKVYVLSESAYSDNGDEILRLRSCPHISSDGNRLSYSRFQLDMETGIGLDGDVQGSSPTVMLDWSDNGGHTWSSEQFALADVGGGEIGDFKKRVVWRRLGSSRDRIFRVKMTDPVKAKWINAMIDVEGSVS